MGKKFTDFVNSMNEQAKEKKKEFNPQERIDFFKNLVKSLYDEIDEWLDEGLKQETIKTGLEPIQINEELLGPYTIDSKWILIGNAKLMLLPVGTVMIGTNARIDLIYKSQSVMIVRTKESVEGPGNLISIHIEGEPVRRQAPTGKTVWKYVRDRKRLSYVTLNKDSFEDLIMDLVNETR